jgi:hypothetical protein
MTTTSTFIDQLASGQSSEAKETLSDLLSARAFEALDARKQDLGATLFGSQQEPQEEPEVEITQEEFDQLDELSKNTLRSYLKGSKAEAESQLRGDVSDKAASLGRTQQDKDDGRYEGNKLARRKLGAPGSIPPKVMAK